MGGEKKRKKANNNHLFTVTKRSWRGKWTLHRQTLLVIEGKGRERASLIEKRPSVNRAQAIPSSERQQLPIRSPTAQRSDQIPKQNSDENPIGQKKKMNWRLNQKKTVRGDSHHSPELSDKWWCEDFKSRREGGTWRRH